MKKNMIYTFIAGLLLLATVGCEDYLDIQKHGNIGSQDDYYQTDEETESASAALYLSFRSTHFNWFFLKNLLADDLWTGGGTRGDNASMEQLNEYTFGTDHSMIEAVYSGMYTVIYNANLIIDKVAPNSDIMKRAIAEAKFFRAFAHFELVTLYGSVPKVDHLLEASEYRQGNSSVADLWAFIEQDLNDAINALPSKKSIDDRETGIRITKEVAQAYLGKAFLFQKKYSDAAQVLDKVIESGKYGLYEGEYGDILHAAANNGRESMLECQLRNDAEQAWSQFTMLYLMNGWRTSLMSFTPTAQSTLASGTYGFCNPKKSLYDAFVAEEGADGYRLKETIHTYAQMKEAGVSLLPGNSLIGNEGIFFWKNRALKADCIYDAPYFQGLQYINPRVMRYAEVLLLAAEAHVQSGGQAKADTYTNQIRSRARLATKSNITLADIKTEKRLELCLESCRYQDLVRWGDAENAMKDQGKTVPAFNGESVSAGFTNTVYGFKSRNVLLPIPAKEIQLNPNMTQNDGWQ